MGGRGPRFSPGEEVLDPLAAQVVVLEDGEGRRTLWMSIDMIGMAWSQTSGFRQEMIRFRLVTGEIKCRQGVFDHRIRREERQGE